MPAVDGRRAAGRRTRATARTGPPGGARFALFGECLLAGVLATAAVLPVVTLLPALAAGCAQIRAQVDGESTSLRAFAGRVRAAYPGSLPWSLGATGAFALLALDVAVIRAGALPGAGPVAVAIGATAVGLAVVLLRAAAAWTAGAPWPDLVRAALSRALVTDRTGSLLLVMALGVLIVVSWQLPPLAIPMLGCVLMAAVAVDRRPGARRLDRPPAPAPD